MSPIIVIVVLALVVLVGGITAFVVGSGRRSTG